MLKMSHKYDLLTVNTGGGGPPKHYPWYKERLNLKFLNTSKFCTSLNGAKWRFVSSGLDDFRSGLPLKRTKMVKKGQVNPVPIIDRKSVESLTKMGSKTSPSQGMILGNPGLRTLYDKVGARQQVQEEHINRVEASLLQHPLALYPHLEEAIPPDIVNDVVDMLDPEMNELISNSEASSHTESINSQFGGRVLSKMSKEEQSSVPSQPILIHAPSSLDFDEVHIRKNPSSIYKFPLIKTEAEKEQEMNLIASQQVISAKQQSRVKQVTHDLVQWAEQLGGSEDSAYIDEQTIKSLFGSNYETKPILMAPIQVVELTSIPPELRPDSRGRSANSASTQTRARKYAKGQLNYYGFQRVGSKGTENWPWLGIPVPQVVKTKYGAWYLPVRLWKLISPHEPLTDPKLNSSEVECEQATRKKEMDVKISALHGAKAFKEFTTIRRGTVPSILEPVKLSSPASKRRTTPQS